jgi:RNA polymerase sigma factor (sigma-70 family)
MHSTQLSQTFHGLMAAVRSGLPAARERLVALYGPHVLRAVRRNLPKLLRTMLDSSDLAQSIWKSFFADHDRLGGFRESRELRAFLVQVARNKTIDEARYNLGKSRKPPGEKRPRLMTGSHLLAPVPAPVATASQEFAARETLSRIKAVMTPAEFRVIELKRLGYTLAQIASLLGIGEKAARRVIRRLERKLEDEDGASSKESSQAANNDRDQP